MSDDNLGELLGDLLDGIGDLVEGIETSTGKMIIFGIIMLIIIFVLVVVL